MAEIPDGEVVEPKADDLDLKKYDPKLIEFLKTKVTQEQARNMLHEIYLMPSAEAIETVKKTLNWEHDAGKSADETRLDIVLLLRRRADNRL